MEYHMNAVRTLLATSAILVMPFVAVANMKQHDLGTALLAVLAFWLAFLLVLQVRSTQRAVRWGRDWKALAQTLIQPRNQTQQP
jgi:hypothetical protein